MYYHKNTTQIPNLLLDNLLKMLTFSELKVLLTIVRKTTGQIDKSDPSKRVERAWISQRLFSLCCNLSGRAVSTAIDSLVHKQLIEVTDKKGNIIRTKSKRRGASRLYYASLLRLEPTKVKASEQSCQNPVNKCHTIKLNTIKQSCYNTSQGVKRLSDVQRFGQIQKMSSQKR